jgi:membrane protein implicated in regulation of membrane protease activity
MRKAIFFGFIAAGAAAGLLAALNDDWGLRLVMMAIGAVVGAAIGGAATRVGKRPPIRVPAGLDQSYGQGTSAEDRDRNYWRDQGHPPFMKPPSAEPDRHMFNPDRIT